MKYRYSGKFLVLFESKMMLGEIRKDSARFGKIH
jgi:hypothetical protein